MNQTERVQALADISRSRCCYSNETRAPIANRPNSAQPFPKLHPGPCGVGMRQRTDTRTDTRTDARDQYTFRVVYDSREM